MFQGAGLQHRYLDATRRTGSARDIEYQLFSSITGRMNRASRPDAAFPDLVSALNENTALWREIALDVIDDDNGLPPKLRAQLFYLYEFTASHTRKVLQREADASALIDINTAIMKGLRQHISGKGTDQCPA